jgi:hypothetical protein
VKRYVCWGTWTTPPHPCGAAHEALVEAGHDHEVVRGYGWKILPDMPFNQTPARKHVKDRTGSSSVPALELDDGTIVQGSREIVEWAKAHPASTP